MVHVASILIYFAYVASSVKAAKILCVYQSPYISHHIAFRYVTEEFLKRGHEVDVITTDPAYPKGQTPENLTEIDVHDVTYNIWRNRFQNNNVKRDSLSSQLQIGLDTMVEIVIGQFNSEELNNFFNENKSYDIVLAEGAFPASLIFSHLYKVPFVHIATFGIVINLFNTMGVPRHILYYPESYRDRGYNITGLEIYKEIYKDLITRARFAANEKMVHETVRDNFIPDLPTHDELNNNVNMLLVNMNPVWEGVRPYPPNYIGIHGFIPKTKEVIPKDIQTYLDSSKNGVIYSSFGTSIKFSLLPERTIAVIFGVFSQLPYEVLLRCDEDELPGRPSNVKLFKWLPQLTVLKHPKIKLLITQGGQHSIDEAIEAGVPLIVIPESFDQFVNSERCVHHRIGAKIDLSTIREDNFIDAIKTVIEDKRYRENILKLRIILQDTPMRPMDRLLWAIGYILRHRGAKHMRSPSANLSNAEFFELELLCIIFSIIVVMLLLIVKILLTVKRCVVKVVRDDDQFYDKFD